MPRGSNVKVDTRGFGKFNRNVDDAIQLGLRESGQDLAEEARSHFADRVRTGKTVASIQPTLPMRGKRGWYLRVMIGTWYGRFQETGRKGGSKTGRMKGARGLRQALYGGAAARLAETIGRRF